MSARASERVVHRQLARYWRYFRERCWFPLMKSALASAGTAFIKWGQWASTRPDLLPRKLCDALSKLHSGAPAHSFELTRVEVTRALGVPLESYFESFDEAPVASGSIGQVHLARLGGRTVAVKVRHPGVELELQTDFYLMSWVAWAVQQLLTQRSRCGLELVRGPAAVR